MLTPECEQIVMRMTFHVKKTVCDTTGLVVNYQSHRAGYIVTCSDDAIIASGDKLIKVNGIDLISHYESAHTVNAFLAGMKKNATIEFTTAELDPVNPRRDHEIYPKCRRIFTLIREENMGFGFSVTTKHVKDTFNYEHTIGRVIESGAADLAGIRNQMKVVTVNGETMKTVNHGQMVEMIGNSGEYVLIGVKEVQYKTIHHFTGRVIFCKMI